MADFTEAVTKTLGYEGGLVDDPRDPGKLTNWGISLAAHPEIGPAGIRIMTKPQAIGIYQAQYWPDSYSQIENQKLADCLFDFGVTSGVADALAHLVKALRECVAGTVLPETKGLSDVTLKQVSTADQDKLIQEFVVIRLRFYVALNKPEFLTDWFDRTIKSAFF